MPTARLIPSSYSLSNESHFTVTSATNAYANTDSADYATFQTTSKSTSSRYVYLSGFNFGAIPDDAVVSAIAVKVKGRVSGVSSSAGKPQITDGTNAISGVNAASTGFSGTEATISVPTGSMTWADIKALGANFSIRLDAKRNARSTASYLYIYGAEIEVTYTVPVYTYELYEKIGGTYKKAAKVFKKVNGAWTEQTNLSNTFESGKLYINGDFEHKLITSDGGPLLTSSGEQFIISKL